MILQYKYLIVEWIIGVFDHGSAGKKSACTVGEVGLTLGLGRSPGEGKGYSGESMENSMACIVHGVAKSWTWLSDFHFSLDHLRQFLEIEGI